MPGIRVDGNDVLAIIQVTAEAAERARRGDGPTMIEALTYRRGAHSSSDDPSVYRNPEEPVEWEKRDPIQRYARFLERRGLIPRMPRTATEIYAHPLACDADAAAQRENPGGARELAALTSVRVRAAVERAGFSLTTYDKLQDHAPAARR